MLEFALSMQVFFPLACGHINSLFALGKTQELSQELTPGDDSAAMPGPFLTVLKMGNFQ